MLLHIVNAIGGIERLGEFSICLFFLVFGGAFVWAFCQKKDFLRSMETLPLRDDELTAGEKGDRSHE